MFTGKRPYAEVSNISQFISGVVMQNALPRRPFWLTPEESQTDNMIWALLTDCWQRDPKARPSARSVERQVSPSTFGSGLIMNVNPAHNT